METASGGRQNSQEEVSSAKMSVFDHLKNVKTEEKKAFLVLAQNGFLIGRTQRDLSPTASQFQFLFM